MKLGIIGGSGLYDLSSHLENVVETDVDTPFGKPSERFVSGSANGVGLVFLARHGLSHSILPGELNHKANIYAMKKLGVSHILSISAVGSLKECYRPRDVVVVDQFFDRTKPGGLDHTFFGEGVVGHISFGDPVCPELAKLAYESALVITGQLATGCKIHQGGTYLNMEGPAFSTRAESELYRSWGMDVIGMTNLAEAKLSREAGICYSSVAMVTDYDCWHPEHDSVTLEMILGHLHANKEMAREIIFAVAAGSACLAGECRCRTAAEFAIVTPRNKIPHEVRKKLSVIFPALAGE